MQTKGEPDMPRVQHILAAVDLSDMAATVVDYARCMAHVWKAQLTVLHVVHDLSYYSGVFITEIPLAALQHQIETEARERLADICAEAFDNANMYDALVVTGRSTAEIPRVVHERDIDCLVIGSHSSDKPEHHVFGSTAERLLHLMPCPTVVVPPIP